MGSVRMVNLAAVREATPEDVDRVVALWGEHVDFHAECDPQFLRRDGSGDGFAQHLRNQLGKADHLLLVAEIDGDVVGFLNGELLRYAPCFANREHGFIDNVAVAAERQRRGIGTALLERAMAWFLAKGVPTVEGKVLLSNPLAMGFWRKTSFQPYMQTIRASTKLHE